MPATLCERNSEWFHIPVDSLLPAVNTAGPPSELISNVYLPIYLVTYMSHE